MGNPPSLGMPFEMVQRHLMTFVLQVSLSNDITAIFLPPLDSDREWAVSIFKHFRELLLTAAPFLQLPVTHLVGTVESSVLKRIALKTASDEKGRVDPTPVVNICCQFFKAGENHTQRRGFDEGARRTINFPSTFFMNFHVLLQGVVSVEPIRAKVTGKRFLSTVDAHMRLQAVLPTEPFGALGTCKGSGRILGGRTVLCNGLEVALCVLRPHFKIKALLHHSYAQYPQSLQNLREVNLRI